MTVETIKDVTVTVKAGQKVDIPESEAKTAIALGLVKEVTAKKTKKGAAK